MERHTLSKDPDSQTTLNKHPERLGRRGLIITVIGYFIVVSLIIGLPFYLKILAPWRQTILQVGKVSVTTHDLIKRLRLKPPASGQNQLELATNLLQEIQNLELIRREALRRGIGVPEQELDREIRRRVMASSPSEGKFEDLYGTVLRRMGLKEKEYRNWVRLEIYQVKLFQSFIETIPEKAEQVQVYAMVTNEAKKAEAIRARLQKGEDFNRLAGETSIDIESAKKGGELGWIPRGVNDLTATGPLQAKDIQTSTKSETAQAGEKMLEGKLIDDMAFNLPIGKVSPPLKTMKGFYLLKITARENQRPLSQEHRLILAEKAMMGWLIGTAKKGGQEGWIRWNWGSEIFNWVISHLN